MIDWDGRSPSYLRDSTHAQFALLVHMVSVARANLSVVHLARPDNIDSLPLIAPFLAHGLWQPPLEISPIHRLPIPTPKRSPGP